MQVCLYYVSIMFLTNTDTINNVLNIQDSKW